MPQVTAVRLIPSPSQVRALAGAGNPTLSIDGLDWLPAPKVELIVRPYLGKPLTRGGLARLDQALVVLARSQNRPVVDIYAPPQDVSSGTVQLVVLVADVGKIRVENNRYFSSASLAKTVRAQPGQPLVSSHLLEDINALNQNPFHQVNLIYARGDEAGQTDVILDVHDVRPEQIFAGYNDTGNAATGLGRAIAGFNLGNLWDIGQQLSYQYTRSTDGDRVQAHSGSTTIPLPWRDTLEFFGSWARADTDAGSGFALDGLTRQAGLRYTIFLPLWGAYTQSLVLGADYKWSNNNLSFGGTQVFASPAQIAQGVVGYTGSLDDAFGSTQASVSAFSSPGGLGGLNSDEAFAVQRAGARAAYSYYQLSVVRLEKLPQNFTLVLTMLGQWSADRLLPSEQFGLGGVTSVRGYDDHVVEGDSGVSGQLELRTPGRHLLGKLPDQTQALVFLDAGRDWQHAPQPGEVDTTLVSAGPGLRMAVGRFGSIRADYGWDLKPLPGDRRGRIHLSVIVSY